MHDSEALLPSSLGTTRGHAGFEVDRLLAPREALAAYFKRVALAPSGEEVVPLIRAAGRVLARDVAAREDIPTHARSTMDGYAISSAATGRERRVAGEVLMGHAPPRAIAADEAMRVPTGGAIPDGADAVIPQEDVERSGDLLRMVNLPETGACITPRGEDVRAGELVLTAGRRVGPPELGVLATLGVVDVAVYRRPRIAVISTGDELIDPAAELRIGTVRDSNRYALAAALEALGAEAVHIARVADTEAALDAALRDALAEHDGVITSGGSSVGDRDLVPRIVAGLGSPGIVAHGLRVKPGKPTLLAATGSKPVIGLPGNPASALMIFEAIVRPIVLALCGETAQAPNATAARAVAPFSSRAGWTWFVPATLRLQGVEIEAAPLLIRSSHASLLARASGYVVLDEHRPHVVAGDLVTVVRFSGGGAPVEVI